MQVLCGKVQRIGDIELAEDTQVRALERGGQCEQSLVGRWEAGQSWEIDGGRLYSFI